MGRITTIIVLLFLQLAFDKLKTGKRPSFLVSLYQTAKVFVSIDMAFAAQMFVTTASRYRWFQKVTWLSCFHDNCPVKHNIYSCFDKGCPTKA